MMLDMQHIELAPFWPPKVWYKQAILDHARQQANTFLHQPRLALPVEGCHPCPKPFQNDQRQRWISLLARLMSENSRCTWPPSKARPKRSSDSGTSRSIAAMGTAWRS